MGEVVAKMECSMETAYPPLNTLPCKRRIAVDLCERNESPASEDVFELGWGESRPARSAKIPPPSPRNFNSDESRPARNMKIPPPSPRNSDESRPARNAKMPPPSPRNFNSDATQLRPRRMDLSPVPQPVLLNSLSSSFDQDDLFAVPDFVRVSQTPPGPSTSVHLGI